MKYTKSFVPKIGHRILIEHHKGLFRILGVGEDFVSAISLEKSPQITGSFRIEDTRFIYRCPWYLFWQKY